MSQPTEMWAVTRGSYDDYRVLCVASSKAVAKKISEKGPDYSVEAIPFFDRDVEQITIYSRTCEVWDDGTVSEFREYERVEWEFDMVYPEYNVDARARWVRAPVHRNRGGRLEVNGTDEALVVEVFDEIRQALLTDYVLRKKSGFTRTGRPAR